MTSDLTYDPIGGTPVQERSPMNIESSDLCPEYSECGCASESECVALLDAITTGRCGVVPLPSIRSEITIELSDEAKTFIGDLGGLVDRLEVVVDRLAFSGRV